MITLWRRKAAARRPAGTAGAMKVTATNVDQGFESPATAAVPAADVDKAETTVTAATAMAAAAAASMAATARGEARRPARTALVASAAAQPTSRRG